MVLHFMVFFAALTFLCLTMGMIEVAFVFAALFFAAPVVFIGWYVLHCMKSPPD
jgi:hypothetical protein